jgi:hypothetical protein
LINEVGSSPVRLTHRCCLLTHVFGPLWEGSSLQLRLHERLGAEPSQTIVSSRAPTLEPHKRRSLEPFCRDGARKGGSTRLHAKFAGLALRPAWAGGRAGQSRGRAEAPQCDTYLHVAALTNKLRGKPRDDVYLWHWLRRRGQPDAGAAGRREDARRTRDGGAGGARRGGVGRGVGRGSVGCCGAGAEARWGGTEARRRRSCGSSSR